MRKGDTHAGADRDAQTHGHANARAHLDRGTYVDAGADGNTHTKAWGDAEANGHAHVDARAHVDAHPDVDSGADGHAYPDTKGNAHGFR